VDIHDGCRIARLDTATPPATPSKLPLQLTALLAHFLFYAAFNVSNKVLLSRYMFPLRIAFIQCFICSCFLIICRWRGFLAFSPFKAHVAIAWTPVVLFFVLQLIASQFCLDGLPLPIFLVCKCFSGIIIFLGEKCFFNHTLTPLGVLVGLVLMAVGAVAALLSLGIAFADKFLSVMAFSVLSAAYILALKVTTRNVKVSDVDTMYYNFLLALPLCFVALLVGDLQFNQFNMETVGRDTLAFLLVNGASTFFVVIASFWSIKATSGFAYSLSSSVYRLILSVIADTFLPDNGINTDAWMGILCAFCGTVLHTYSKASAIRPHVPVLPFKIGG